MSKIKETLAAQQKISNAVKEIIEYFAPYNEDYAGHLEQMLNAQTQILGLMEVAKTQSQNNNGDEFFCESKDIIYFLHYANDYLKLLKPFAEMAAGSTADN